jgi:hypothetical protein
MIQRRLLRRALRQKLTGADVPQGNQIRAVLSDRAMFETVYEQAMQQAATHANETGMFSISTDANGSPIVDNLLKLLTWFVDNGPALIGLIELIVGLFGTAASLSKACGPEESETCEPCRCCDLRDCWLSSARPQ